MKFALLAFIATVSAAAGDCKTAAGEDADATCTCTDVDNCTVCLAEAVTDTSGNGSCQTCADGFAVGDDGACAAAAKAAAGEACTADDGCDTGLKCGTYEAESTDPVVAAGGKACVASADCDSDDNITCGDGAMALGASLVAALAVANLM